MAFVLKIIGNGETADFLDGTEFKVMDGGFDIGTPEVSRRTYPFGVDRYQNLDEMYDSRSASIRFEIHGTNRSDVISKLHKIERIIGVANNRYRMNKNVELQYAWDGQSNITYFDVIGADPVLDPATLSVERMFETRDGKQVLGGLVLNLKLSPFGYYISPVSGSPTEVALAVSGASKTTGGVTIYNPYSTNADKNWIEIAGSDIPSGGKLLTRLELTNTFEDWETIHIGQRITPFPSSTLLLEAESSDATGPGAGTVVPHASASNGNYVRFDSDAGTHAASLAYFAAREWFLDNTYKGRYLVMANFFGDVTGNVTSTDSGVWMTSGIAEFTNTYRKWLNRWRKLPINPDRQPIGVFQVPIDDLDLDTYGTPADTELGVLFGWDAGSVTFSCSVDSLTLLPIDQGYRVLVHRENAAAGTVIDDGWRNVTLHKRTSDSKVIPNVFGLYDPIRLVPNVTQRLYFNIGYTGTATGVASATSWTARLYVVPTSVAMAV